MTTATKVEIGLPCAVCETENNPRRTFCRSCGALLKAHAAYTPTADPTKRPIQPRPEPKRRGARAGMKPAPRKMRPEYVGTFSSTQVIQMTDTTYRQLDYWCQCETITPTVGEGAPGTGNWRRFAPDEVFVIAVVADLMCLGAQQSFASAVATWVRSQAEPSGRIYVTPTGAVGREPVGSCYSVDLDALRVVLDERAAVVSAA